MESVKVREQLEGVHSLLHHKASSSGPQAWQQGLYLLSRTDRLIYMVFNYFFTLIYICILERGMWRGVLVEVRGYYKRVCPAMEVLWMDLWWARWWQTPLPTEPSRQPCFYFSRQSLGYVAKARLKLSTLAPQLFERQDGRCHRAWPTFIVWGRRLKT